MSYSAITGKSVRLADGQVQTHVTITNDLGQSFEDDLSYLPGTDDASTLANLAARVKARIAQAQREVAVKQVALLPVGTVLDLSDPVVTPAVLTKAQQVEAAWWDRFNAARTAVILATVPDDVRNDYLPEYGSLR